MNDLLDQELQRYSRSVSNCFEVSCGIYDLAKAEIDYRGKPCFCEYCGACSYPRTHLYGCYEAERWGGKYIYYCPMGMIFLAHVIYAVDTTEAALVTGPMLMGDREDLDLSLPPDISEKAAFLPDYPPARVHDISELIHAITTLISSVEREEYIIHDKLELALNNKLYEIGEQMDQAGKAAYPIADEKGLLAAISAGDKDTAQELLNRLLGHIYFHSGGDFETIRTRVSELLVLLSRASIDGGADIEQIFWANRSLQDELQSFTELNRLNHWLSAVIHRYISYVFDFTGVKHVDVIHKATAYIKQRYTGKLTLDEVASHVYLSKSYLSKIFKEELHCNFASYINNLRVEKSKLLLMDQSINLADLAGMVGFEDQSYFTKVFKRIVGVSPGKYRENRGGSNYKKEK